jgi:hypothetical protein
MNLVRMYLFTGTSSSTLLPTRIRHRASSVCPQGSVTGSSSTSKHTAQHSSVPMSCDTPTTREFSTRVSTGSLESKRENYV